MKMKFFPINENYPVTVETYGNNKDKIIVVDDFYTQPYPVRQLALDIPSVTQESRRKSRLRVNAFYVLDEMAWIYDPLCRQYYPK